MIFYTIKRKLKKINNIIKLLCFIYNNNSDGAYTMMDNIIND
jgi:hypothetical protein